MAKKIFVGNLPFSTTSEELKELFAAYGEVISANVVTDRATGRSRGFGFVEMESAEADAAIGALNGKEMDGRALRVDQANERPPRQ
ncbi:MAG: RNA-binding protein [Proteobacteria bacterium]|nr:RNA-binding protein [Pseudomonadota bacterium]MBU4277495.1 RNA-binding protein [Pseudomonadota bacterium]MBU4384467.1 RNA-binding protein [Pseudomonadota bacterium]MBU4605029.1 RNA-binding protein [Pseudomonadota bacterium]MCG2766384.1 RNA-binding protein [Desulfarculaceae bacterium]